MSLTPEKCEALLQKQLYLGGQKPNIDDVTVLQSLNGIPPDQVAFPMFHIWFTVVSLFHENVVNSWKAQNLVEAPLRKKKICKKDTMDL